MEFLLLFLSLFAILMIRQQSYGRSTIDFQVGVVLDLNSSDSPVGRIGLSSLSMACSDFYSHHGDFKTRLVLSFRDSNGSVVEAHAAALDLMQHVKVDAIIGPQKSKQTNFVMDLGDRAHVPIISFSATSPSLVPRTPYFVRTAQSDANQVGAIASIIRAFRWSRVVMIYEDTEYGSGIVPHLSKALQDVNARVSYSSVFPGSASDDFISKELHKMMTMQTRVFVVHMTQSIGSRLFLKAEELGMMSKGYAWIVTSGLTDMFNLVGSKVVEAMQGVVGVQPLVPKSEELHSFSNRRTRLFLEDSKGVKPPEMSIFGLWAHDTFRALAIAAEIVGNNVEMDAMKNEANVDSRGLFALEVSERGPKLLQALLATRFSGLAGEFKLVNGQLDQTSYQIVNVVGRDKREVGIWTPSAGISRELNVNVITPSSTSKENFRTIIWPGDLLEAPRGWEIPINAKKLRIGVPQKPGFNEFLKAETDPTTNATKVSGYFKEVFDSVMAALPYVIPYEYIAYQFFNPDGLRVGSYDDLVYQVSLQEDYDAGLGDITITASRSIHVDFTLPFAEGGVASIVPIKYEDVNDVLTFSKAFTKDLWLTTAAFYFVTALAIWILGGWVVSGSRNSLGEHAGLSCYCPSFPGEGFGGSLLCVVLVMWALIANLLSSTYTASLSSLLAVQKLKPTITDVTQLIENGDYVGCQEGSFLVSFLKKLGFEESRIRAYRSTEDCDKALTLGSENGGISAYYDVVPHIRMILSQYCGKYTIVGPTYRTDGFAIAFPKGFPAVADISRAIIQLTENGTIQEIERRYSSSPVCSSLDGTGSPAGKAARSSPVLFLIAGCVTCLLISLSVFLSKNRTSRRGSFDVNIKILNCS